MAAEKALLWAAGVQWLRIMGTQAELYQLKGEGAGFISARDPCQMISDMLARNWLFGGMYT